MRIEECCTYMWSVKPIIQISLNQSTELLIVAEVSKLCLVVGGGVSNSNVGKWMGRRKGWSWGGLLRK